MQVDRGWYEDEAKRSATWPAEGSSWPSLGWVVVAWIELMLVHGPGAKKGEKIELPWESICFLVWAYRIDPDTGRRCFDTVVLSRAKGWAKSALDAFVKIAEAVGPVRFSHWDEDGRPVGKPVKDPWIRLMATEEGQATENTFAAVRDSILDGPVAEAYGFRERENVQADRIVIPTGGKIAVTTRASKSADGGRETHAGIDEAHLYILPVLQDLVEFVLNNMTKRDDGEPWALVTTTAYALGEGSYAEKLWDRAARLSDTAPIADLETRFLFDHREGVAMTREQILGDKQVVLANLAATYGDATWMVTERVVNRLREMTVASANRFFFNVVVPGEEQYLSPEDIRNATVDTGELIADNDVVCVGFDGSRADDGTALVVVRLSDGLMQLEKYWQRPDPIPDEWRFPHQDVEETMNEVFRRYRVVRFYADPPYWNNELDRLRNAHPDEVYEWFTARGKQMHEALERFRLAVEDKTAQLVPNATLRAHLGNAVKVTNTAGYGIAKPKPKFKIDATVAAALAWEARADALVAGEGAAPTYYRAGSWN